MAGPPSDTLDKIATGLSEFTDPDIPELPQKLHTTVLDNALAGILGAFSGEGNAHVRHIMTNIVRRISASAQMYQRGRENALDYVAGDRYLRIVPYFHALAEFEGCISNSWLAVDLIRKLPSEKKERDTKIFEPGDGSELQRLHAIYTDAIKHPDQRYNTAVHGEMPTSVWMTNEGLSCITGTGLTYRELANIIEETNAGFYFVQDKALEKRRKASGHP